MDEPDSDLPDYIKLFAPWRWTVDSRHGLFGCLTLIIIDIWMMCGLLFALN